MVDTWVGKRTNERDLGAAKAAPGEVGVHDWGERIAPEMTPPERVWRQYRPMLQFHFTKKHGQGPAPQLAGKERSGIEPCSTARTGR